jgi:tetratricopeptide (TPR) repeat protein
MTNPKISLFAVAAGLLMCVGACSVHAEALIKPVPQPNASKLPPESAKELTEARAAFDKVRVNLVGDQLAAAYAQLGALYMRDGFNDAAAIAFYDATQLAPKDQRWLYVSGVVAHDQKREADARAYFESALAIDQDYPPIRFRLADTLAAMGDLEAAHKVLLDGLKQQNKDAALYAFLGRVELKQHRYGDAIEHLGQALTMEPQANALNKDIADAYAGQGDKASAAAFEAKAGQTPPTVNDPIIAGIYKRGDEPVALTGSTLDQAHQLIDRSEFAAARTLIDLALKTDANDAEALALAARLDGLLGKATAAQDEASRALKIKPDSASANLSQGMVYEFAGDDVHAATFYQRAIKADPNQPDARLLLGNALMREGQYLEAAEQYRKLTTIASHRNDSDAHLAAALFAAGRCREGLNAVNEALAARARDGELLQVFVRVASTCKASTAEERSMALDYGQTLYQQRPNAADTIALALAQAANGKFDDAQKSQAEAIFQAERAGDAAHAKIYRDTMRQYAAKKVPEKPWPTDHPFFKPPKLTPLEANPAK